MVVALKLKQSKGYPECRKAREDDRSWYQFWDNGVRLSRGLEALENNVDQVSSVHEIQPSQSRPKESQACALILHQHPIVCLP